MDLTTHGLVNLGPVHAQLAPARWIELALSRKEGVLGGGSSGASVWAAVEVAKQLGPGKRIVTVIPDGAERYMSKGIFSGK